jgi:hypothetical protein
MSNCAVLEEAPHAEEVRSPGLRQDDIRRGSPPPTPTRDSGTRPPVSQGRRPQEAYRSG